MLQPGLQQGNWEGGDRLGLGGKQPGAALATVVSKDLLGLAPTGRKCREEWSRSAGRGKPCCGLHMADLEHAPPPRLQLNI